MNNDNINNVVNDLRNGVLDVNIQELFVSSLIKGLLYNLNKDIKIRNISVPHMILHTGDDRMWLETKGYDAYQFYYDNDRLSLLLGEVKFYASFSAAIKKILDNLEKAVSPEYFGKNVLALINEKGNFDSVPQEISEIIEKWESNPDINLYNEVVSNGIQLHYPMLVLYDATESTFDDVIKNSVSTINSEFAKRTISIGMDIELFFILIPVESAKIIKEGVIEWISKNEPLR